MENKGNSAIPGARPAPPDYRRKVESGSLMPQFGGGQGEKGAQEEKKTQSGKETRSEKDARDEKDALGELVVQHEPSKPRASAESLGVVTDAETDEIALPTPAEQGIGIDLNHLDELFKDQPGKGGAKTANAAGANGGAGGAGTADTAAAAPGGPTMRPLSPNSPLNRPMQKVAPPAPPQKPPRKSPFMLVCAAIAAVALVITIAIVVAVSRPTSDPVALAIEKILNGQASPNVEIHGNVSIDPKDRYALINHYDLKVDVELLPNTLINDTDIRMTVKGRNVSEQTFGFEEVYAANGAVYLRASGVVKAMENIDRDLSNAANGQIRFKEEEELQAQQNAQNAQASGGVAETDEFSQEVTGDGGETVVTDEFVTGADIWSLIPEDSFLSPLMQIAQDTDNTWVQIPVGDGELAADGLIRANSEDFTQLTCRVGLFTKLRNNLNTVMQLYRRNPFIGSTTDGVTLEAVNYPVRKLVFDEHAFISFANAMNDAKLLDEYFRCAGINIRDMYEVPKQLPEILVEVNGENDFTRVVWATGIENGTLKADLGLKYPTSTINVRTPGEFMTWNQVLQMERDFLDQNLVIDDTVYDEGCPECDPEAVDCFCEGVEVEGEGGDEDGDDGGGDDGG